VKNLGDKLKSLNIQGFLTKHGEKLGMAFVVLIVASALYSTEWAPDPRTPNELLDKVQDADTKIAQSNWPEEKRSEVQLQDFLAQARQMVDPLAIQDYEYSVEFFDQLVKQQQLITSPKWVGVQSLIADDGVVLMEMARDRNEELLAEQFANANDEENNEDSANLDLNIVRRKDIIRDRSTVEDQRLGGGRGLAGGRIADGTRRGGRVGRYSDDDDDERDRRRGFNNNYDPYKRNQSLTKARGQRYAAIRGLIDIQKQKRELIKALNLTLPMYAEKVLHFRGFRIQRQRAVAGQEPWKEENWEELDIDEAVRVLADANGFALPILDPRVTNPYVTMPLPPRLMGYWTHHATHPELEKFALSEDERQQLEEVMGLLKEQAEQLEEESDVLGGFAGLSEDIRKIRDRTTAEQLKKLQEKVDQSPSNVGDRVKEMFGLNEVKKSQLDQIRSSRGDDDDDDRGRGFGMGRRGRGALTRGRIGLQQPQVYDQKQQLEGIEAAIGRILLFRYLDFTVKPGEAYRYRVKLIYNNPAFNAFTREQVDDEAVILGQERESEWSEPSSVVVIPPDTHAFVTAAALDKDSPGRQGANFEIFQWHQQLGTVIHDKMRCTLGQFIGGAKSTLVLNLAKPSFKNERTTFTSDMALVDAEDEPRIDLSDHPDLRASLAAVRGIRDDRETRFGVPAEAVVVREDGTVQRLDSISTQAERDQLEQRLNLVRGQYDDLKNIDGLESLDDRIRGGGRRGDDDDGRRGDRGSNVMRRGGRRR